MWLLLIIALNTEPPYKVRGSISIPYRTEAECKDEMNRVASQIKFKDTRIDASCTFRGYLAR